MAESPARFAELLERFIAHEIEFVVVGGVAAVLQGVALSTFDLDLVHRRTPENLERLEAVLAEIGALYNDPAGRRIVPDRQSLDSPGHHLLTTSLGPLDILGSIGEAEGYESLLSQSVSLQLDAGKVKVLGLEALLRHKLASNRVKDRLAASLLRELLKRDR